MTFEDDQTLPDTSAAIRSRLADAQSIAGFYRAVQRVADQLGVRESGYRVLANTGRDAHQEVQHYHLHLFAGCDLGSMLKKNLAP